MSRVASPPSSTMSCGPEAVRARSAPARCTHQYSSSVSPFQAKTGTPAAAMAAAAWSWVEKMLQEHPAHVGAELDERLDEDGGLDRHVQRAHDADALRAASRRPYFSRVAIRPGISCSAISISLRPKSARPMSRDFVVELWFGGCAHSVLGWDGLRVMGLSVTHRRRS